MKGTVNFEHRGGKKNPAFGHVGAVEYEVAKDGKEIVIKLDGTTIPATMATYLIEYGIRQSMGDSYASATNVDEARTLLAERVKRIVEGGLGLRGSGSGLSERLRVAMAMIKAYVTQKSQAETDAAKEFASLKDDAAKDWLRTKAEANLENEAFAEAVDKECERRAAVREANRKAKEGLAVELSI